MPDLPPDRLVENLRFACHDQADLKPHALHLAKTLRGSSKKSWLPRLKSILGGIHGHSPLGAHAAEAGRTVAFVSGLCPSILTCLDNHSAAHQRRRFPLVWDHVTMCPGNPVTANSPAERRMLRECSALVYPRSACSFVCGLKFASGYFSVASALIDQCSSFLQIDSR